jgi:diaminohydroxyphosphoribosylaminopyrimidine deaminase / 5-amino-6-(5-phosphoribosylamino)uracil reductase
VRDRERDRQHMLRAVALGETARPRTAPNPWVGCVVVRDGTTVGEGATAPPGGPHAEISALAAAGDRAAGATVYVTLEPCAHVGRTGPCAAALLEARVARVVVGVEDPDARVAGQGIDRLRAGGVEVEVGCARDVVDEQLAAYLHHRRTRRALCLLKTAASLDGRVAAADGSSRWITGPAARDDAHRLRAESQAVVIGSGTALADRPTLTARPPGGLAGPQPRRVILDARGRVPADGALFDTELAPTTVLTTSAAAGARIDEWTAAGAKVIVLAPSPSGVDLEGALEALGADGVLQAMVEGGPRLHGALVAAGLADRIVAYVAGVALGPAARAAFDAPLPPALVDAPRFALRSAVALGDDVRLDYVPRAREA